MPDIFYIENIRGSWEWNGVAEPRPKQRDGQGSQNQRNLSESLKDDPDFEG